MISPKVIPFEEASQLFASLKAEGKTLVQCHGTFDLIHPGHIYHFEEAKALGEVLVVTITGEEYVNKGPGRPYFNDQMRAKSISALSCVDYVVLVPHVAAVEAIDCVRPNIYCKGREYENPDNDVTGNIHDDIHEVEKYGGQVRYIGSVVFSSTKLINQHFDPVPDSVKEYCAALANSFSPSQVRRCIEDFSTLKILVIGDIIFDRYSYVKVQGLTSKNRILSTRFLSEETHAGGALVVHRHLSQFCPRVDMVGLLGTEPTTDSLVRQYLPDEQDCCVRDPSFTTIIKQRFVEPVAEGKEVSKLFSVNYINDTAPSDNLSQTVFTAVRSRIRDYDMVVVADFGHGLMSESLRRLVESEARFMALNCQTNSNNHGFNIISRQYQRADCFSLDEQELMLSCAKKYVDFTVELENLRAELGASQAWLTRGITETIGVQSGRAPCYIIPLASNAVDTVGAGDAFFSVVALAACMQLPLDLGTLLGQLAGAQAVQIVGNSEPVSKGALLKSVMSLLNF